MTRHKVLAQGAVCTAPTFLTFDGNDTKISLDNLKEDKNGKCDHLSKLRGAYDQI